MRQDYCIDIYFYLLILPNWISRVTEIASIQLWQTQALCVWRLLALFVESLFQNWLRWIFTALYLRYYFAFHSFFVLQKAEILFAFYLLFFFKSIFKPVLSFFEVAVCTICTWLPSHSWAKNLYRLLVLLTNVLSSWASACCCSLCNNKIRSKIWPLLFFFFQAGFWKETNWTDTELFSFFLFFFLYIVWDEGV